MRLLRLAWIPIALVLICYWSVAASHHARSTDDADANALCDRVPLIKRLPFKPDDQSDDPAYNDLVNAGHGVIPCLIDRITDTAPMQDPRGTRGPHDTRVGDVAYFMVVRIAGLEFTAMLPDDVRQDYEQRGVAAYHAYVSRRQNRAALQSRLHAWYDRKRGQ